jgi:hypothetical protein
MILDLRPDLANHQNFIDIYGLCIGCIRKTICCNYINWDVNLPFSFANLKISRANSCLSSSQIEFPFYLHAFTKVKVIPPPIIMWSTLSKIFSITVILDETLEPPKTAVTGFHCFQYFV